LRCEKLEPVLKGKKLQKENESGLNVGIKQQEFLK